MLGVVRDTKAVTRRLGSLVKLHLELAKLESKKKAIALGVGIGLGGLALILVLYAIGFGFASGAVGLTELLPLWASLLIVMGALLLGAGICGFLAMRFVKKGAPPCRPRRSRKWSARSGQFGTMADRSADEIRKEIAAERNAFEDDLVAVRGKLRWVVIVSVTATVMVSGVAVAAVVIKRKGARAGIRAGLKTMLKLV